MEENSTEPTLMPVQNNLAAVCGSLQVSFYCFAIKQQLLLGKQW